MPAGFLLVALAYLIFALVVGWYEARRIRANGIDPISLFVAFFMLQCCLSPTAIYGLLPFVSRDDLTSVYVFDRILSQLDVPTALLIFFLTVAFLIFFYVGCGLGRVVLERLWPPTRDVLIVSVNRRRIILTLFVGMLFTMYSFMHLGDTMLERYTNLILLRSYDPLIERTALNANAFALTQAWSWLSIVAVFCFAESRQRILLPFLVLIALAFAVLGVSRRALFLPMLMAYLTIVLYANNWRLRWLVGAAIPLVVWVAFGKVLLASVAYNGTFEAVADTYQSWQSAALRAASDVGVTVVESLGTVQSIHLPPRLGSDHILSLMKMFPERTLGFDVDYPERIVRISTTALDDPYAADLPPGLMGQMWLDFRLAGPLVWGIAFGLQISVLQWLFERLRCTRQSCATIVVLLFLLALPLNTGSFDFTFSVDVVATAVALLICVRVRRGRLVAARRLDPNSQQGFAR